MTIASSIAATMPWMPNWLLGPFLFLVIVGMGLVLQSVAVGLLTRVLAAHQKFGLPDLFARVRGALRFAIALFAATVAFPVIPMAAATSDMLHSLLIAATIVLGGWITVIGANTLADHYIRQLRVDVADNLHARKAVTQMRILKRAADTLLILLTIAFALMSFPSVRQFGVSLFASAGVAGLVMGLAARPLLENLFAGVQLALTQPIRIDDVLVVQGQWGWVEEITSTYVVMRLWDLRRLVLPLSYFLQNPFENWTRTSSTIIGSITFHLDYTAPVDAIRAGVMDIVHGSALWDGNVVNLQVTDATDTTIELRVLVTAVDSPTVWDLRCEVREKVLAFIRTDHPSALPRWRAVVTAAAGETAFPAGSHDPRP